MERIEFINDTHDLVVNFNHEFFRTKRSFRIIDLRKISHPEFQKFEDLESKILDCILQNGIRYYENDYLEFLQNASLDELHFKSYLKKIFQDYKNVVSYVKRFGKDTTARYTKYRYETFDSLQKKFMLKNNGVIYTGNNLQGRIDLINRVIEFASKSNSGKILEAGCGAGLNLFLLTRLAPNLSNIEGFEYTNSRIASAIVNLVFEKNIERLFLADVTSLKLESESYDVVFTCHVLEQLGQQNAELAIDELLRITRKYLIISEPTLKDANLYEKWRMKKLGYCENLLNILRNSNKCRIIEDYEDPIRYHPNTSYTIIVEKL